MHAVSEEPILKHIQEPVQWDIRSTTHWMLRIVDVKTAIECRGYPRAVSASLCFDIEDDLLPANHGVWRISVSEGKGRAEKLDAVPEG